MCVIINEIRRRSDQGVTRPFLCRADNGKFYFVKGTGVGKESLRAEWIAGCLAASLELPVPPFAQVQLPEGIITYSTLPGIAELGRGTAFGSEMVSSAQEIRFLQAIRVNLQLQTTILLFDWWIQNTDRTLTVLGGNPNILSTGGGDPEISIIDHHGAFDPECDPFEIWSSHVFRSARPLWTDAFRAAIIPILQRAFAQVPLFWSQLPETWVPEEDHQSRASKLELDRINTILKRPFDSPDRFWGGVL